MPRSIQNGEIAAKGSAYLRRNNMAWKDGWIVQQPGPKNSLGLVKFDMRNEHQIYLHDTPAKSLFDEVQRQRSHGCVRVEDALGFADMLARDEGITAAWQAATPCLAVAARSGFLTLGEQAAVVWLVVPPLTSTRLPANSVGSAFMPIPWFPGS